MDQLDSLVIGVRADTSGFAKDVAAIQTQLEGPLATSAKRAGSAIDTALTKAITSGNVSFAGLEPGRRVDLRVDRGERGEGRPQVDLRRRRWDQRPDRDAGQCGFVAVRRLPRARDRRPRDGRPSLCRRRTRTGAVRADRRRTDCPGRRHGERRGQRPPSTSPRRPMPRRRSCSGRGRRSRGRSARRSTGRTADAPLARDRRRPAAAGLAEALRRALLDGRFPAADDGRGDDAGRASGAGRPQLPADQRPRRADLGVGRPVGSSAARLCHRPRLSRPAPSAFAGRPRAS